VLEMLIHVTRDTVPADLILVPIDVPDELIIEAPAFPSDWNALPFTQPRDGLEMSGFEKENRSRSWSHPSYSLVKKT
jgi:hypothetical protein